MHGLTDKLILYTVQLAFNPLASKDTFTDRERFIQALSIFTVSPEARARSTAERSDILDYIRNKFCKSITNDDWAAISNELNKNKEWILDAGNVYKNADPEIDVEEDDEDTTPEFTDDFDTDDEDDIDDNDTGNEVELESHPQKELTEPEFDIELEGEEPNKEAEPPKKTKTLRGILSKKK